METTFGGGGGGFAFVLSVRAEAGPLPERAANGVTVILRVVE